MNHTKPANSPSAEQRYQQAMVDADIEGLARNPETEKLIKIWQAQGVSISERIERLKQYY